MGARLLEPDNRAGPVFVLANDDRTIAAGALQRTSRMSFRDISFLQMRRACLILQGNIYKKYTLDPHKTSYT